MSSRLGRKYLTRKSPPDPRDLGMARLAAPIVLPPSVDLTSSCSPVRDQGQMGSCTAFASTAMLEFLYRRYKALTPVFSPLFQYYNERVMDGDLAEGDTGSTGRTAVKCINQFGVCLEEQEPYNDSAVTEAPTAANVTEAASYTAGAYHAISNVQDMKACLASGYVFIVGFTVYESFESDATAASGLMPVPNTGTEQVLGGHEVCFVGYDDTITCPGAAPGAFKVKNSWGTGWGESGYFWFAYQCAADSNVLMDAFIQHFGKPW